eukprot:9922535-Alexandrium_andersonii.AAC.1
MCIRDRSWTPPSPLQARSLSGSPCGLFLWLLGIPASVERSDPTRVNLLEDSRVASVCARARGRA